MNISDDNKNNAAVFTFDATGLAKCKIFSKYSAASQGSFTEERLAGFFSFVKKILIQKPSGMIDLILIYVSSLFNQLFHKSEFFALFSYHTSNNQHQF